jgi:hypothetical protein
MKHEVATLDDRPREVEFGEVPLMKADFGKVIEVAAFTGYQRVSDADGVSAPDQFFRKVRADESGATGDEIS